MGCYKIISNSFPSYNAWIIIIFIGQRIHPFRLIGSLNHGLLNASLCVCSVDKKYLDIKDLPRRRSGVEVEDWQMSQNSRISANHFLPGDYKKNKDTNEWRELSTRNQMQVQSLLFEICKAHWSRGVQPLREEFDSRFE